jgi:nucleotide-binding universal stress UspA family protein
MRKGVNVAKILVGYDGSESAKRALERAAALADGEPLTLVSAVDFLSTRPGFVYDPIDEDEVERHLHEALARLRELGVGCQIAEGFGHPAEVITKEAEEIEADLIVVGSNHKAWSNGYFSDPSAPTSCIGRRPKCW